MIAQHDNEQVRRLLRDRGRPGEPARDRDLWRPCLAAGEIARQVPAPGAAVVLTARQLRAGVTLSRSQRVMLAGAHPDATHPGEIAASTPRRGQYEDGSERPVLLSTDRVTVHLAGLGEIRAPAWMLELPICQVQPVRVSAHLHELG